MRIEDRKSLILRARHNVGLMLRRARYGSPSSKVFVVGLQKTGTTSIQYALSLLGYRVGGTLRAGDLTVPDGLLAKVIDLSYRYDAVADHPWALFFRELDAEHPGSKFILTTRDPDRWYASVCKHFGDTENKMRTWIYGPGAPTENRDLYIDRLIQHERDVREYFANRPADLLEIEMAQGHGWTEICPFINKPVPKQQFPRLNVAKT